MSKNQLISRCWVRFFLLTVLAAILTTCAGAQSDSRLFAYSTLDALLAGVYDGDLTVSELRGKGDFGIGTFNHLDGEMIMLDGVCYHAKSDGSVEIASPQDKTPLAYATHFHGEESLRPELALSLVELETWLDRFVPNKNLFYAIRIEGQYQLMSVRAIPPQSQPYKPLAEVAESQVVHDYQGVRGVLVGIRSPAFSRGISVSGYHWHFITGDRKHGGHVVKLKIGQVSAQLNEIAGLDLQLPRHEAFASADQTKDRTAEVKKVEGKE